MLRSKLLTLILTGFLTSCGTTHTITKTQTLTLEPPAALYQCPDLPTLPSGQVTDEQTAQLISDLANMGITCKQSLTAVRNSIEQQKKIIQDNPVKDVTD